MMSDFENIIALLKTNEEIPKHDILEWMRSQELTTLGAVHSLIQCAGARIKPPLAIDEVQEFLLTYFTRCILENPEESDFLASRYSAGHGWADWITDLYSQGTKTKDLLQKSLGRLKELYLGSDEQTREGIVSAVLEYLFEQKDLVVLFEDWKTDPQLQPAYNHALHWAQAMWGEMGS